MIEDTSWRVLKSRAIKKKAASTPARRPRARAVATAKSAVGNGQESGLAALLAPKNGVMLAVEKALLRGDGINASPPIAEQIAARMAGLIALDILKPGQRLFENDISGILRVSRSPVRESIRILERDHLVQLHARRGATVTAPREDELQDIFEVRTALFAILLEQVMRDRPADLQATLEQFLPLLEQAAGGTAESYAVQSFLCNLAIADLCSNRLVVDQLKTISLRTLRYVRLGLAASENAVAGSLKGWHVFHQAVAKRDVPLVIAAATRRISLLRDFSVAEIGKSKALAEASA